MWETLSMWSPRRWYAAAVTAVATVVLVAVPTAMIPTPIFGREVPPTWWSWPVLIVTAALSGLLFASYVRQPGDLPAGGTEEPVGAQIDKKGMVGGVLTYFAVGCPVCNKIALIALGSAGALRWFAPIQPYLGIAALGLLVWGLKARLDGERSCPVPAAATRP